jgi:hypothetical protein
MRKVSDPALKKEIDKQTFWLSYDDQYKRLVGPDHIAFDCERFNTELNKKSSFRIIFCSKEHVLGKMSIFYNLSYTYHIDGYEISSIPKNILAISIRRLKQSFQINSVAQLSKEMLSILYSDTKNNIINL